jgi:hypothetical protein
MIVIPKAKESSVSSPSVFLGITWFAGLFLGWFAAIESVDYWQRSSFGLVIGSKTVFASLLPSFLPFLFSALAVCYSAHWLLFLVCGIKAFLFGLCGFSICLIYHQCSWLVRLLFMFSDLCAIPILYLYWLRSLRIRKSVSWGTNICFCCYFLVISGVDLCLVWPFTEHLFSTLKK